MHQVSLTQTYAAITEERVVTVLGVVRHLPRRSASQLVGLALNEVFEGKGAGHADEAGAGDGLGFNLNVPLAPGSNAPQWFAALETACLKIAMSGAEALVVSLGVDTFIGDPAARFGLASADFLRIGERIAHLDLPAVFVLEGGSAMAELGTNVVNVLEGFETAI